MFQTPQNGGVPSLPLSSVPFGGYQQEEKQQSASHQAYSQHSQQQYQSPSQQSYTQRRPHSPGSLDAYNTERVRSGLAPQQSGYEDARYRDAYSASPSYNTERRAPTNGSAVAAASSAAPQFTSPYSSAHLGSTGTGEGNYTPSTEREAMKKFASTRTNTLRPVVFQPNGSFRALKENGKLAVGPEEASVYKGRIKNPLAETAYHLPGYTGFVRGSQHISGRTFGETSRRALTTDYREIVCSSPVPSSPQANRKIRHEDLKDTFVANMFGGKTYQIPGYTGFVPGVRNTYAKRYGASTEQEMLSHSVRFPRRDNQPAAFARTQLPRENYPLSSAPLPGGALSQEAPTMYIPETIRYLKFFPQ